MDKKEIDSYCDNGSALCVYRKRVKKAQFVVQSISILRGNPGYYVRVTFDALTMVDQGEGLRWGARSDDLDLIVESLERFLNQPICDWTNYSRVGLKPFYNSEDITAEHYQNSWRSLEDKYKNGKLLLPKGLKFELQTPDLGTLKNRSKYQRPNK